MVWLQWGRPRSMSFLYDQVLVTRQLIKTGYLCRNILASLEEDYTGRLD